MGARMCMRARGHDFGHGCGRGDVRRLVFACACPQTRRVYMRVWTLTSVRGRECGHEHERVGVGIGVGLWRAAYADKGVGAVADV